MNKYTRQQHIDFPQKTWPSKHIETAPEWCSVDLRDGNQALINPMSPEQKLRYFQMLTDIGFKDIEISFPSASDTDFRFTRCLIEGGDIPTDTRIQILTQARKHLIDRSFEAIRGAPDVIIHLYNSTSPAQREVVFRKTKAEVIDLAVEGTRMVREQAIRHTGAVTFEYSPESFSQTEPGFAVDICNKVIEAWDPSPDEKMIINLPSTVEITSPNVFADMVEYVVKNIHRRDQVIISIHTHNDRGCAVAAAELGLLAGADRIEGTLFGNGERTGNADIMTLALNMFSQGIATGLYFNDIGKIVGQYEQLTDMQVSPRHPYAGSLVFTAFSGSHQDAISKGMTEYNRKGGVWRVPYLPVEPKDLGRTYEGIIRINSQSGKGGAAWILEQKYGFQLPREMLKEVGTAVQIQADMKERELSSDEIYHIFYSEFVNRVTPFHITDVRSIEHHDIPQKSRRIHVTARLYAGTSGMMINGNGNGIIDALTHALHDIGMTFTVHSYHEHDMGEGSEAKAVAYVAIESDSIRCFGVGIDTDIAYASVAAMVCALNRQAKIDIDYSIDDALCTIA